MFAISACFAKEKFKFIKSNSGRSVVEYQGIEDSCQETVYKMMENTIGLQDGLCYKIRNRADNTVVEFMLGSSNKLICGQEVTNGENSHQIFEAVEEDSGQFRIACKYQSSETQHFWDYLPHRKQLIHKKKSNAESSLQLWSTECVPGMDTAFFIISVQNEYCLKSNGKNKQVSITEKNESDPRQHWRLEVQPF